MISLGTFIICCVLSMLIGELIGEQTEFKRSKDALEDLKNFYHENTKSLMAYIEKINNKKGGE